jgi:hypothetical protein
MKKVIRDFECAMCGRCCACQDLVQLTAFEMFRLASNLEMAPTQFYDKYCELTATNLNPSPHLYIRTANGACPFLRDGRCGVYEVRPYACKAYPMRVYWSPAGDVKELIRSRYPMLENTCSLFKLDDGDVLLGDYELLAKQMIAYWVDDAYFTLESERIDLSIPKMVADFYIHDKEMLATAKRYVVNPDHPPSAFESEEAYARISLTLQAAIWGLTAGFTKATGQSIDENERIGKYMLLSTDGESAKALRLLIDSGRMDLARTLVLGSKSHPGRYVIGAIHGSPSDHIALASVFYCDKETIEELTDGGKKPLYVFFMAEGDTEGKLAGFPLNVKL